MVQNKPKKPSWEQLSTIDQDLYLTLLWKDGHTENAIAIFLDTTKGRIVRRRSTLKLKNKGRKTVKSSVDPERFRDLLDLHAMGEMEARGVAAIAPVEKTTIPEAELEQEKDEPVQEPEPTPPSRPSEHRRNTFQDKLEPFSDRQRTASREKPKYQITADWRLQCIHHEDGLQCSYEKEPDSDYCKLHRR